MPEQAILYPRRPVPALEVETLSGSTWRLADEKPDNFILVVFYRGLHCPICAGYLRDLDAKIEALRERGVTAVAISSDGRERGEESKRKWRIDNLEIGYGLSLDKAREWGLYISQGIGKTSAGVAEPALFSEPAIYLVRPDGTLYFGMVQTMPFARPQFDDILKALDVVIAKNYPARGEVVDFKHAAE
jgi:peroxiredoxin